MVVGDSQLLCHSAADTVDVGIHRGVCGVDGDVVADSLDDTTLLRGVATDMLHSAEEKWVVADNEVAS